MLLIHVSQIPSEGKDINAPLASGDVHVEGEESFTLEGGRLRCRLEKGEEDSVHIRGELEARLRLQCGRCLESFALPADHEVDLFYLPHRAEDDMEEEDEVELADHEMVVAYYQGDRLDLGEMIREQLILGLPMKRVCREDCRGLCPACGVNRNTSLCECPAEPADPRLVALAKLFDKG